MKTNTNELCEACATWAQTNPWTAAAFLVVSACIGFTVAFWWSRRLSKEAEAMLTEIKRHALEDAEAGQIDVETKGSEEATVRVIRFRSRVMIQIIATPNAAKFVHNASLLLAECGWIATATETGWMAVPRVPRVLRVNRLQPNVAYHAA